MINDKYNNIIIHIYIIARKVRACCSACYSERVCVMMFTAWVIHNIPNIIMCVPMMYILCISIHIICAL